MASSLHPSFFGLENALRISKGLHFIMIMLLLFLYVWCDLGWLYLVGIGVATLLLMTEHKIIKPSNQRMMKVASYHLNQVISMVILFSTLVDYFYVQLGRGC